MKTINTNDPFRFQWHTQCSILLSVNRLLLLSTLTLATASADLLITPTGVTTNGVSEFFPTLNIINNSGLSESVNALNYRTVTHAGASGAVAWTTNAPNGATDYFTVGSEGTLPIFTFTLPSSSTVNALVYWGYYFGGVANGNEAREFFVEFSQDGGNTFPESATVASELSTFAIANSIVLPFEEDFTADTIRVSITDNQFGSTAAGGDRIGLGEIKFVQIVAPPLEAQPVTIASDGSQQSGTFTLANTEGTETYSITGITIEGSNASLFNIDSTFPIDVPVNGSVDIDYTISPTGSVTDLDVSFAVSTTPSGDTPVVVPVSGFIYDPWIQSSFTPLAGDVTPGETITANLALTNDGATANLVLSSSSVVFDPSSAFSIPDLSAASVTIPPKGAANVVFTFDSTGLSAGTYNAIFSITSNDISRPQIEIPVSIKVAKTPVPASLVGWWPFDGSGSDQTSFAHPITEVGSPNYTAAGANANTGSAATFDGTSSITIPATGVLNPDSFTVTLWANPDNLLGFQSLITSRTDNFAFDGRTYGYILYMDNAGDWAFWSGDGDPGPGTWVSTKLATNDPLVGQWSHLALTYDRSTLTKTLYLNGEVLVSQEQVLLERNLLTDLHIGSGSDTGTQFYYQGKIDDLAVFHEVLSPAQIMSVMNDGVGAFAGLNETLAITGLEIDGNRTSITSTTGLRSGVNYHLETGNTLEDFQPFPDTNFTSDSVSVPSIFSNDPKLFIRIVEGPGPVL